MEEREPLLQGTEYRPYRAASPQPDLKVKLGMLVVGLGVLVLCAGFAGVLVSRVATGGSGGPSSSARLEREVVVGGEAVVEPAFTLQGAAMDATPRNPRVRGAQCEVRENTIVGTGSVNTLANSSVDKCCAACIADANCWAYTFAKDSNTCFLKDNAVFVSHTSNRTSGVVGGRWSRACVNGVAEDLPFCNASLSMSQRLDDLVPRIFLNESGAQLTARSSPQITRLGLPAFYWGTNAIHGMQNTGCLPSGQCPTSFPSPCSLAATFNMTHVGVMANIIGREMRAYFNNDTHLGLDSWSPTLNVNRDPRWGRNVESPGEDPTLCGSFAAAYTHGIQTGSIVPDNIDATPSTAALPSNTTEGPFQVAVTLKHWLAYSLEMYLVPPFYYTRHNFSANVSEYDLQATYLVGWKKVVREANPKGVMCSYNFVNGKPTCGTPAITSLLRDTFGFNGYITSDTDAVLDMFATHHFVPNLTQAVRLGLEGGCDINSGYVYSNHVREAVEGGEVGIDAVHAALRNAYETRFKLGLFDPADKDPWAGIGVEEVGWAASQDASLRAARDGMVLLKNDGVGAAEGADGAPLLPLHKGSRVAVIGKIANNGGAMLGNYNGPICADGTYSCVPSLFDRVLAVNEGGKTVAFDNVTDVNGAVKLAKQQDAVVLVVDNASDGGFEGLDRIAITLDDAQTALATAVATSGAKVVMVMVNGGVIAIDHLKEKVPAILEAFMPGVHGAQAIAETLFGDNNPGGKLPVTIFPADYVHEVDFLNMSMTTGTGRTYRYYTGTPLFPFGFGLSYTTFQLTWSTPHPPALQALLSPSPSSLPLTVRVRNTGTRAGSEVVFGFVSCCEGGPPRSLHGAPVASKELFAYQRVWLEVGEEKVVTLEMEGTDITLVDANGHRGMHAGRYTVAVSRGHGEELVAGLELVGRKGEEVVVVEEFKKWW